eukprot:6248648-Prymnesium_polylepis.1
MPLRNCGGWAFQAAQGLLAAPNPAQISQSDRLETRGRDVSQLVDEQSTAPRPLDFNRVGRRVPASRRCLLTMRPTTSSTTAFM